MSEVIEQKISAADIAEVMEKLGKIQGELFVPKGQRNDFGKYNYRSCEDILTTVKPLCEKYNCTLLLEGDIFQVGDRYYYKAVACLYDRDSKRALRAAGWAREEETKKGMDGSQITGATISYARKYALAGLFCIDNEKDSDATNTGDTKKQSAKEKDSETHETVSERQIAAIQAQLDRTGISVEAVCNRYKVKELKEMTQANYVAAMKGFEATPDKEAKQ